MYRNPNQKICCARAQIFFYGVQSIRNAAETYIFSIIFLGGENMENDVNSSEILCIKISENPLKGLFTSAGSGDEQN